MEWWRSARGCFRFPDCRLNELNVPSEEWWKQIEIWETKTNTILFSISFCIENALLTSEAIIVSPFVFRSDTTTNKTTSLWQQVLVCLLTLKRAFNSAVCNYSEVALAIFPSHPSPLNTKYLSRSVCLSFTPSGCCFHVPRSHCWTERASVLITAVLMGSSTWKTWRKTTSSAQRRPCLVFAFRKPHHTACVIHNLVSCVTAIDQKLEEGNITRVCRRSIC